MRARTWAIAAMAVVGMGAGATPASAASDAKTRCIKEAAKAGVLSADTNPRTASFVGGTDGRDRFTADQLTPGVDVVCGFGGSDSVQTLSQGDIFLGGKDTDVVGSLDGGTFNGGAGDDGVQNLNGGTFNGGEGTDYVASYQYGGTFNGGEGTDIVISLDGGTFNGGAGDDSVFHMFDGTFNGGEGNDFVNRLDSGTFNGGAGDDSVGSLNGGTFIP